MGVASLALLAWALYWTMRLERADWLFLKGDTASIRQAMRLAPKSAEYASALAQAEPDRAVEILREAAAENPLDGGLRLELGLAEERRGDFASAERSLHDAIRLDRGLGTRAALSDFYFHRHDAEKFWPAVREALAVSYGDDWEQFRQCWSLSDEAQTILERAIPDRPQVLRFYLDFLLSEGRPDAATPVAKRVLARADRESALSLLNYCDRMLEKWRGDEARFVWDGLVERKLIAESGRGFDWRISEVPGIRVAPSAGGWTIHFSGNEPESAEILSRYVALSPHRRYVLHPVLPAESGLKCELFLSDGRDLPSESGALQAPDGVTLGRLVLAYRRLPGTTRLEGTVHVSEIGLSQ
jgi:tetratricopeptide (TPR) repeat protein